MYLYGGKNTFTWGQKYSLDGGVKYSPMGNKKRHRQGCQNSVRYRYTYIHTHTANTYTTLSNVGPVLRCFRQRGEFKKKNTSNFDQSFLF